MLLSTAGLMLLSAALDLITIYIALEILQLKHRLPLRVEQARRPDRAEAGMKFFLLSAMLSPSSYGIALIYGTTGQVRLDAIARELTGTPSPGLLPLALVLVLS